MLIYFFPRLFLRAPGSLPMHLVVVAICRASDRSRKKKSNFAGFLGTKSWKNRPISQEFPGNIQGKLGRKAIGEKMADFVVIFGQISLGIDQFCTDQTSIFNVFLTEVEQYAPEMNQWQSL